MKFSLIICTYKRPGAVAKLLETIEVQELKPNEILIIDSSPDSKTSESLMLPRKELNFHYYKVGEKDRGLTKQRNYGIMRVAPDSKVIAFLDDDVILAPDYFKALLGTYKLIPEALGVGGYIVNEILWVKGKKAEFNDFKIDGYLRKLGSRNVLRKTLGLLSDKPPGIMPNSSHGLSIGFLPPSGKTYPVEYFMGGVASYRKELFEKISFSNYFEGYGLYEDMDFCLRASKIGQLYVNTMAQLHHHHEESGRPNKFVYGKMVIRNGWYVWRVKYPRPELWARLKWHGTALLLTLVRIGNILTTNKRKEAATESLGRIAGWWSLFFDKPLKRDQSNKS